MYNNKTLYKMRRIAGEMKTRWQEHFSIIL